METMVLERSNRLFLTGMAHVLSPTDEVSDDVAAAVAADWKVEKANPFIKWVTGNFVEADKPNSNNQFWTKGDLELGEYSIRYSPLNMVHKVRQPVGFFLATRMVDLTKKTKSADKASLERTQEMADLLRSGGFESEAESIEQEIAKTKAAEPKGTAKIEAMSGMWTHVFPFESALVDQAHDSKALFYSMECRGTHITCAGDQGCGTTFEYMDFENHCEHLKERASVRHIVNPTFRGGALIIPPFKPGWKEASATIQSKAVMQEAAKFAEQTEASYDAVTKENDLTPGAWEHLMATIIGLADA